MIQVIYAQGRASQTSDVGSIAIARSINLVDSVALPLLTKTRKWAELGFELWIGDPAEINGKRLKKYENSCGKERGRIRFSSLTRSEEHTSELQSRLHLVCRLLLEKKKRLAHATTTGRDD